MRVCTKCGGSWAGAKQFDTTCAHDFGVSPDPKAYVMTALAAMSTEWRAEIKTVDLAPPSAEPTDAEIERSLERLLLELSDRDVTVHAVMRLAERERWSSARLHLELIKRLAADKTELQREHLRSLERAPTPTQDQIRAGVIAGIAAGEALRKDDDPAQSIWRSPIPVGTRVRVDRLDGTAVYGVVRAGPVLANAVCYAIDFEHNADCMPAEWVDARHVSVATEGA